MRVHADHPYTDPGDGRQECETCGKWVWLVTHSCKGVPVTEAAMQRMSERLADIEECDGCGHRADREQLHECANSIPVHRGPWHCDDCLPDCSACAEDGLRDWQADHGVRPMRRS